MLFPTYLPSLSYHIMFANLVLNEKNIKNIKGFTNEHAKKHKTLKKA